MNWYTLLTLKVISGLVKVAYYNAPTTNRYKRGSGSSLEPKRLSLQLLIISDAIGLASIMLALASNSLIYFP